MLRGSARVTKDLSIGKKAKYVLLIMRPWNKKFFSSHVLNISVDIEVFFFFSCFSFCLSDLDFSARDLCS